MLRRKSNLTHIFHVKLNFTFTLSKLLSSEKQNNERYVFHWKLQVWSKYFPNIASDKYDYANNLIQDFCALELRQ